MRSLPKQTPSITIQDNALTSKELIYLTTAASTLMITISVSIALWKVAQGVMWAIIILAIGSAGQMVLTGLGIYHLYHARGQALIIEAKASLTAARRSGYNG